MQGTEATGLPSARLFLKKSAEVERRPRVPGVLIDFPSHPEENTSNDFSSLLLQSAKQFAPN